MRTSRSEASLLDQAEREIGVDDTDPDEELRSDEDMADRAREAEALLAGEEPEPESLTPEELETLMEPDPSPPESALHEVPTGQRRPGAGR